MRNLLVSTVALFALATSTPIAAEGWEGTPVLPAELQVTPAPPSPANPVVHIGVNVLTCSGFYVGGDMVVTAGHCVSGNLNATFKVVAEDGHEFAGYVAAYSKLDAGLDDWAIIKIKDTPGGWTGASLDCSGIPASIGTEVRAEGFPATDGNEYRVTWGRINGKTSKVGQFAQPVIHAQLAVAPGNSGGPLYREKDDKVLGIVIAVGVPFTTYTISQPIAPVCALLHRA